MTEMDRKPGHIYGWAAMTCPSAGAVPFGCPASCCLAQANTSVLVLLPRLAFGRILPALPKTTDSTYSLCVLLPSHAPHPLHFFLLLFLFSILPLALPRTLSRLVVTRPDPSMGLARSQTTCYVGFDLIEPKGSVISAPL